MPAPGLRQAANEIAARAAQQLEGSEVRAERDCVVVLRVARREKQRNLAGRGKGGKLGNFLRLRPEFRKVPVLKLGPAIGIMAKPGAKAAAWRDVPEPNVYPRTLLGEPARPQAIDKHPASVRGRRRFVDALDSQPARCS
jgi:hypothetical protein